MLNRVLIGLVSGVVAATLVSTQEVAPQGRGGGAGQGRGGGPGAGLPTQAQWDAMPAAGKQYVEKARALAGNDPDLLFDFGIFCKASGGSTNEDRAAIGVPNSEPRLQPYPAPNPSVVVGGQRLFDNFYWFGDTGVGAWLITSNDGYILFDAMDNEEQARDIIVASMKKMGLDPARIRYVVFGHHHFDHTGGGEYIQRIFKARAVMHRDDWDLYLRTPARGAAAAAPKMRRDIEATDGMELKVGDVTATIYQMTGHTPGSIGMIVPVRYQGTNHPILLVTAATAAPNRYSFIGGYEHIWDLGIKQKVESVMQAHPNTNMNLLARTKYVHENYPPAKNPLLYGAERTARYINIMRTCTQARMEALGW
jgi:metallo-beta-lactamase superfamily protein